MFGGFPRWIHSNVWTLTQPYRTTSICNNTCHTCSTMCYPRQHFHHPLLVWSPWAEHSSVTVTANIRGSLPRPRRRVNVSKHSSTSNQGRAYWCQQIPYSPRCSTHPNTQNYTINHITFFSGYHTDCVGLGISESDSGLESVQGPTSGNGWEGLGVWRSSGASESDATDSVVGGNCL